MCALAATEESNLTAPTSVAQRRTVAVVDMVDYGSVARILEENISAHSVADLNRQIQAIMTRALAELPNPQAFCVVSRPGDGIILLFDHAEEAHCFAVYVHNFAAEHNSQRTERLAERWFRIGVATGEVTATSDCAHLLPEYAGITIAIATRLESAARPGEIIIDIATFRGLPTETQLLYGPEITIEGKRKETFRAHRLPVSVPPNYPVPAPLIHHWNRRTYLIAAFSIVATGGLASWFERDQLYAITHPLPQQRFVALLAWPLPPSETQPLLAGLIDSIHARLTRAESFVADVLILTSQDMSADGKLATTPAPQEQSPDGRSKSLKRIADDWGTNLILTIEIIQSKALSTVHLALIDRDLKSLRNDRIEITSLNAVNINYLVGRAAASILDLPIEEVGLTDEAELANVPIAARALYEQGKLFEYNTNGTQDNEAIGKFEEALSIHPRFALAYAGLGNIYLRQHERDHDALSLQIAGKNLASALRVNPDSERARLGNARFQIASGKPDAALAEISVILHTNPLCTDAILLKAQALGELNRFVDQEQTYRDLIVMRPSYWYAYNNLGAFLQSRAKYIDAASQFKQASLLAPGAATPLINLGTVYLELGNTSGATEAFEKSARILPNAPAFENLGTIAFQQKDYASALRLYMQAQALDSTSYFILADLGDTYEQLHLPQKTIDLYTKAAELLAQQLAANPKDGNGWMILAFYRAKTGKEEASVRAIHAAEAQGAADVGSIFLKARTLMLLDRRKEAEELLLRCLNGGLAIADVDLAPEFSSSLAYQNYKAHVAK